MQGNKIIFASQNKGKIREMTELFKALNIDIVLPPADFDVEEDGETFLDNAIKKATAAAKLTKITALADDSGLIVDALNGAPGVRSSRYAPTDALKIEKLLTALQNIPEQERTARFVCSLAIVDPEGTILLSTSGLCEGSIIREPRGQDGFGFDPIFLVPELNLTMAEIPMDLKNTLSHRARALKEMLHWFKEKALTPNT